MTATAPTLLDNPIARVAEIDSRARRVETPCGAGTMVWRVWGDEGSSRPPVVLGHGAQGAWSHWIRNVDALAASGRMVIAADLPGHGDSAEPPTPDHQGISAVLAEGLRHILGEGGKADLVGFSFSGIAFAWFAAQYPQLVRRLILVGTGGLNTPHGPIDIRRVSGLQGEERQAALKSNLLGLMLNHPETVDSLAMHLLVANARRSAVDPQKLVVPDRMLPALERLTVQLDAIWGELDRPHPNPVVQEEVLRRYQPDLDFEVVPDSGHWVMYERPDAFNAALLRLLDRPLRAAA